MDLERSGSYGVAMNEVFFRQQLKVKDDMIKRMQREQADDKQMRAIVARCLGVKEINNDEVLVELQKLVLEVGTLRNALEEIRRGEDKV